jgi:hypothetical protein
MNEPKKAVGLLELRRLLFELNEHRPDICLRYRLIGQMWTPNFMRVIHPTEKGVILNDETSNKLNTISDISRLMQFELDKPFQNYQPYFHYDVVPSAD